MSHHLGTDLDQFLPQCRQRPVTNELNPRRSDGPLAVLARRMAACCWSGFVGQQEAPAVRRNDGMSTGHGCKRGCKQWFLRCPAAENRLSFYRAFFLFFSFASRYLLDYDLNIMRKKLGKKSKLPRSKELAAKAETVPANASLQPEPAASTTVTLAPADPQVLQHLAEKEPVVRNRDFADPEPKSGVPIEGIARLAI